MEEFCCKRKRDLLAVGIVARFFTELFERKSSKTVYLVLEARAALKYFSQRFYYVLDDCVLKQLIGSFAYSRPSLPRLKDCIWDTNAVLQFLAGLPDNETIPLSWHSVKLCLLILL